ncbi:MAG: hypothetical protein WBZ33_04310 [Thermoactinomyces sp.]|jgi:hypothetical protein
MMFTAIIDKWARGFHRIIWLLVTGTVFTQTAAYMSFPFLTIYLSHKTGLNSGIVGFAVGLGALAGTLEDLSAAICRTAMGAIRC